MHLIGNRERPDFTEPENSQEKARLWISKICPDFEIQRARAGILPPSDIRNNSHWGIGSDKVWQDAPGKVQLRDKDTPRSPGRRPECLPGARLMLQSTWVVIGRSTRNPALELSLIWSVCSHLVLCSCWCCDNVSFSAPSSERTFLVGFIIECTSVLGTDGDSSIVKRKVLLPGKTVQLTEKQSIAVRLATLHIGPT